MLCEKEMLSFKHLSVEGFFLQAETQTFALRELISVIALQN